MRGCLSFRTAKHVELVQSDTDLSDFLFPNGGFNDKRFEILSYTTNTTRHESSVKYLNPTTPLPGSDTEGRQNLDLIGSCLSNMPPFPSDYVRRSELEQAFMSALLNDRHPVVTLRGRGGIGKTSLALKCAHEVAPGPRFSAILWFSARDLDLLTDGPKTVRPAVLNKEDMALEFARLISPFEAQQGKSKPLEVLAAALQNPGSAPGLGPTLFIFDNFETVVNPSEVYAWLDTYIRSPNKILITTRHRDFKGDYPIDVRGMSESECNNLVDAVAARRGVLSLITPAYREDLYRESDGHPYVVKILMGEVAKAGALRKVERVVADADEILTALFERTYATLSPAAQRVFLTLCNWRAAIPKIALEAVLLRPSNEKIAVDDAIDELERSSFIELSASESDGQLFITTPLVASLFGKKKLLVSPMKASIDVDTSFLREFGPGQRTDVGRGVAPRILKLIGAVARRMEEDPSALEQYVPMLDFIARHHPDAWLDIADLYAESGMPDGIERAKGAVRHHLETATPEKALLSWSRLAHLCRSTGDVLGEIHALVELSQLPGIAFDELSNVATSVNGLLVRGSYEIESEEKRVLVRPVAAAMERRISEADSTACSRLAWLHLHLKDDTQAARVVKRGLAIDPNNEHCLRLALRLGIS